MIAGLVYVNIHSTNFPGSELSGYVQQVTEVPVPVSSGWSTGALALVIFGVAAVALRRPWATKKTTQRSSRWGRSEAYLT